MCITEGLIPVLASRSLVLIQLPFSFIFPHFFLHFYFFPWSFPFTLITFYRHLHSLVRIFICSFIFIAVTFYFSLSRGNCCHFDVVNLVYHFRAILLIGKVILLCSSVCFAISKTTLTKIHKLGVACSLFLYWSSFVLSPFSQLLFSIFPP